MIAKMPNRSTSFYLINAITFYRLAASAILLYLLATGQEMTFKWMLAVSFFTDAIDGFLARKFKAISVFGSRLDSLADDLTMAMAIVGIFVFHPSFIKQHLLLIAVLMGLFLIQLIIAFLRYGKPTSFHTYLAKLAAILQAVFLLSLFFYPAAGEVLFYLAAVATILDLLEEILMVYRLPTWRADVKSYWQIKDEL
jgi:phosphatidylglycerophosphate synthase